LNIIDQLQTVFLFARESTCEANGFFTTVAPVKKRKLPGLLDASVFRWQWFGSDLQAVVRPRGGGCGRIFPAGFDVTQANGSGCCGGDVVTPPKMNAV
jgi:hypothetical protein